MRHRPLLAVLAALTLMVSGCSAGQSDSSTDAASASAGQRTAAADTSGHRARASGPSAPARMICSAEIRDAVASTLGLSTPPSSSHSWSRQTFRCTYDLSGAPLALAVKDLPDGRASRAFFDGLRSTLARAQPIEDFDSLGFPAFQTADGRVALIKDGKTLLVDASRLPQASLPAGFGASDAAYAVAAAVIGCWTE